VKDFIRLVSAVVIAGCFAVSSVRGQEVVARSVATYLEVEVAHSPQAKAELRDYAASTRGAAGATRVQLLSQLDRPGRFVLIESWQNEAAWTAHEASKPRQALKTKLHSMLLAPLDERVGLPMQDEAYVSESRDAVHVVAHVDVAPNNREGGNEMLLAVAKAALAMPGALAYEIAIQANRTNHFTVHQVWNNLAAYNAHTTGAAIKDFRARFHLIKGSPYDDRLYKLETP
jgi:quinol monooxygenase YgiN